jgi:hypothetical protein
VRSESGAEAPVVCAQKQLLNHYAAGAGSAD